MLKKIGIGLAVILSALTFYSKTHAAEITRRDATKAEQKSTASTTKFSVEPVMDQQQIKSDVTYWWMRANPGKRQTIHVKIVNGEESAKFDMAVNQAVTNENLTVDYGKRGEGAYKLLTNATPINFEKATSIGDHKDSKYKITLAPHEVAIVPLTINVPKQAFTGLAVGGLSVTREAAESIDSAVTNVFNYTYAIVLQGSDKVGQANLNFTNLEVKRRTHNNKFIINLTNRTNAIIKGVSAVGTVKNEANQTVAKINLKDGTIVPQAKFALQLVDHGKKLPAGKYRIDLLVKDDSKQLWQVKETIAITNNKDNFSQKIHLKNTLIENYWLWGLGGMSLLIILVGIYLYLSKKPGHH